MRAPERARGLEPDDPTDRRRGPRRALVAALLAGAGLATACGCESRPPGGQAPEAQAAESIPAERRAMVEHQIRRRGVTDERVLDAMAAVPRHRFVPAALRDAAYTDRPLPIGHGQTISQPYIVALMSDLAEVEEGERVLEIGTGSGYQAAVLHELGAEVWSIEIVEPLGVEARELLDELGYDRVRVRIGDGYAGWPEHAPFDAVIVTAAPPEIPSPLVEQLAVGGRLVIPVGEGFQELRVLERTEHGIEEERGIPVRFVPMTGRAQDGR